MTADKALIDLLQAARNAIETLSRDGQEYLVRSC